MGDATQQALARQDAQLDLRHVQPAPVLRRVVDLQLLGDPPGLLRRVRECVDDARWAYLNDVIITTGAVQPRFKPGIALAVLRDCLAGRQKQLPDSWLTFNTQSLLGGALLGQKKYAEAEPLLVKGYEGMKAREKNIPAQGIIRIAEALDRLIELYTALNKPDEAKKWQAERAKYPAIAPRPREKR